MRDKNPVRVSLVIIHDYNEAPGECWPGEEIFAIILIFRKRWYWIPWSPTHLILVDLLCRNRRIALDAWHIAARIQSDPFVLQHGTNAPGHDVRPARTSRVAVRQQVKRSRDVLQKLIDDEGLDLDASSIICSEETSTRSVRYHINADVSWIHRPAPGGEESDLDLPFPQVPGAILNSAQATLRVGL
jgi:hypothetical protein